MIAKIHAKGSSFRGIGLYVLRDPGAKTSERVGWTATRNLCSDKPEVALKAMAACAMDAERLKREAGVKATGRRSKNAVLHVTLSWAEEESPALTRDEMLRAADGALEALGARDHQALIVEHTDSPHRHLHLVVNRTSTDDGRFLSSSKEKLAIQAWALEYEKSRGKVLCEERELNHEARARGTFVRGKKNRVRHLYEMEAQHANTPGADRVRQQQAQLDHALAKRERAVEATKKREWDELYAERDAQKKKLAATLQRERTKAKDAAEHRFLDEFARLKVRHEAEREEFARNEATLRGKGLNLLRSIDWNGLLRRERRRASIREAFGLLGGRVGDRSEALRKRQERETLEVERKQAAAVKKALSRVLPAHRKRVREAETTLEISQTRLIWNHAERDLETKRLWKERRAEREKAWERFSEKALSSEFDREATPEKERRERAEAHMTRMRKARQERVEQKPSLAERKRRARERDRGRER